MPQSLSKVVVHLIFSTKDREPWIDLDVRPRIHAYLAVICRDLGAEAFRVGGVADHVHVVTTLPRTVSQAGMIEEVKKTSSKWIKHVPGALPQADMTLRPWRSARPAPGEPIHRSPTLALVGRLDVAMIATSRTSSAQKGARHAPRYQPPAGMGCRPLLARAQSVPV